MMFLIVLYFETLREKMSLKNFIGQEKSTKNDKFQKKALDAKKFQFFTRQREFPSLYKSHIHII